MKKLNFLEKLSKNELKQIKAGEGGTRNGGSSNNGNVGIDRDRCGAEPTACLSAEWLLWQACFLDLYGYLPFTPCN